MADAKTKRYVVQETHWDGVQRYLPGDVIEIPADDKPARNWTPVSDAKPAAPEAPKAKDGKRASDKDAI